MTFKGVPKASELRQGEVNSLTSGILNPWIQQPTLTNHTNVYSVTLRHAVLLYFQRMLFA